MEQFVRDARIAMLYEGANGIQALDLVGRKLALDNGRALQTFLGEVQDYVGQHGEEAMKPYVAPLAKQTTGHGDAPSAYSIASKRSIAPSSGDKPMR